MHYEKFSFLVQLILTPPDVLQNFEHLQEVYGISPTIKPSRSYLEAAGLQIYYMQRCQE